MAEVSSGAVTIVLSTTEVRALATALRLAREYESGFAELKSLWELAEALGVEW